MSHCDVADGRGLGLGTGHY